MLFPKNHSHLNNMKYLKRFNEGIIDFYKKDTKVAEQLLDMLNIQIITPYYISSSNVDGIYTTSIISNDNKTIKREIHGHVDRIIKIFIDDREINISKSLASKISDRVGIIYVTTDGFFSYLIHHKIIDISKLPNTNTIGDIKNELKDRFMEFDVIKNNQIDILSLESVFKFYDMNFTEEIKNKIIHNNRGIMGEFKYINV